MTEKHVYTMPEEFLKDQSVPTHWRLLGIINGFFINGGVAYAKNEWFQERLGVSQKTVSTAISTLEDMGYIAISNRENKRVITPRASIVGGSNELLPPQSPTTTPVVTNDYPSINAVSINAVSKSFIESEDSMEIVPEDGEGNPIQPKWGKQTFAKKMGKNYDTSAVKRLRSKAESTTGRRFPNSLSQEKSIARMLSSGYTEEQIWEEYERLSKDKFWSERGVDFNITLSQIGKVKQKKNKVYVV